MVYLQVGLPDFGLFNVLLIGLEVGLLASI
jgi:hypothetical protein